MPDSPLGRSGVSSDRVFRSMREVCETYFPKRHAAHECDCYPKQKQGVLVIVPRPGVNPQRRGR